MKSFWSLSSLKSFNVQAAPTLVYPNRTLPSFAGNASEVKLLISSPFHIISLSRSPVFVVSPPCVLASWVLEWAYPAAAMAFGQKLNDSKIFDMWDKQKQAMVQWFLQLLCNDRVWVYDMMFIWQVVLFLLKRFEFSEQPNLHELETTSHRCLGPAPW